MERAQVIDRSAIEQAYEDAMNGVLVVQHPAPGILRAEGATRLDFLQRMSTNDLSGMRPGDVRQTVLTTALARIIDVIWVVARENDALLVTSPGRGRHVRDWLQRYIFFQDDVRLQVIEGWVLWGLYGPQARNEAGRIVPVQVEGIGRAASWVGGTVWAVDRPAGGVCLLLEPTAEAEQLWSSRPEAAAAYQIHRIEAGIPDMGTEIMEDSLPLEVGLKSAVSFTKGCYIGQEIIARMESRNRLAKELVGVRAESAVAPGEGIRQAARVVGTVTSAALSPRLGAIALASTRPGALEEAGGAVRVGEREVPGWLVRLPFAPGP